MLLIAIARKQHLCKIAVIVRLLSVIEIYLGILDHFNISAGPDIYIFRFLTVNLGYFTTAVAAEIGIAEQSLFTHRTASAKTKPAFAGAD